MNPALTFTHCSRELAKVGRFDDITQLTKALTSAGLVGDAGIDEIVGASLLVIADTQALDQSETLIQLLTSDSNKVQDCRHMAFQSNPYWESFYKQTFRTSTNN